MRVCRRYTHKIFEKEKATGKKEDRTQIEKQKGFTNKNTNINTERAVIIEKNPEALLQRVRLIKNAKKEITEKAENTGYHSAKFLCAARCS